MSISIVLWISERTRPTDVLVTAARAAGAAVDTDVEIVLVLDGTTADVAGHADVTVVDLSRKFGADAALLAGAAHARGDLVFVTGDDPRANLRHLASLHAALLATDADVAHGRRSGGSAMDRLRRAGSTRLARLARLRDGGDRAMRLALIRRDVVGLLVCDADADFDLDHALATLGRVSTTVAVPVSGHQESRALDRTVVRAFTASPLPLEFAAFVGAVTVPVASATLLWVVVERLTGGIGRPGYAALLASTWLLGGLTLAALGVLGAYLVRVVHEVRREGRAIVRAVHRHRGPATVHARASVPTDAPIQDAVAAD